jgi:hypothetical protein
MNSYFLAFSNDPIDLETLVEKLRLRGVPVSRSRQGTLIIDEIGFEIGASEGPHVQQEANELAARLRSPQMSGRAYRIEVSITNLERALDEFNTLAELQQTIADTAGAILWLSWNDETKNR